MRLMPGMWPRHSQLIEIPMKIKNILIGIAGLLSLSGLVQCTHYTWKEIRLSPEEKQDYEFCFATHQRYYHIRLKDGVQTIDMETWKDGKVHYTDDAAAPGMVKKTRRLPQPDGRLNQLIEKFVQTGQFCYESENDFLRIEGVCVGASWQGGGQAYSWNMIWEEVQERMQKPYNDLNLYLYLSNPQWNTYPEAFPLLPEEAPPHVKPGRPGTPVQGGK